MKRIFTTATIALSVMLLASIKNTASAQPRVDAEISYQNFYDELDPYGRWMDYPEYGYVWIPDAGPDFRPYSTNGHWVWSDDYEWMWVSDYDWGWAPFHYGRWMQDASYGWFWVPGYEWSPAWVAWRDGGDYYGWAPLRPGINISVNFSLGGYNPPVDYWCFAPRRYITSPRIYDYCAPRGNNITIINQTTIINNYNYNRNVFRTGPRRNDAERYTGRINSVRFRESSSPGRTRFRNNEVSVYRPNVQRDNNRNFTPRRVDRFDGNRNNDNAIRRNGNNLPQRRDEATNRGFDRRNNNSNDNGISDRRRNVFNRGNNNDGQTTNPRRFETPGNNDTREANPVDRGNRDRNINRDIRPNRERTPNGERMPNREAMPDRDRTRQRDVTERNNNSNNNNNDVRDRRSFENRNIDRQPRQDNSQRREMRNDNGQQQPRRSFPQMEQRRQEQPRQSFPQAERRQEQPRQEQPRQFERRDNSNNNSNNSNRGGSDNGRGGGRRTR